MASLDDDEYGTGDEFIRELFLNPEHVDHIALEANNRNDEGQWETLYAGLLWDDGHTTMYRLDFPDDNWFDLVHELADSEGIDIDDETYHE
jgi:hypothetical protein